MKSPRYRLITVLFVILKPSLQRYNWFRDDAEPVIALEAVEVGYDARMSKSLETMKC